VARVACLHSVEYYDTVEHPLPDWDKIPYGLAVIAACLQRAGHEVRCWVICPKTPLARIAQEIVHEFRCDTTLASSVTTEFPLISALCSQIKILKPSIPILLGGVHASLRGADCLSHFFIDAVCTGEGENTALAWVNAIARGVQPRGIAGLWIKIPGTSEIDRTPPFPFRDNLDDLPLINYAHWERWVDPQNRTVRVVIGRGCPYSCTYCSNHALRRLQTGPYVRFRSPGNILSEIEMLIHRFPGLQSIYLEVETIGASIPWLLEFCDHLKTFNAALQHPIEFRANLAVTSHLLQNDDRLHDVLKALRGANLVCLNVGLESGSERIRKQILNRPPYTNADLMRFCRAARQQGIEISLYMLIGVPTETPADSRKTSAVARACTPSEIFPSIYYPYPGTELHNLAAQMRLIDAAALGTKAERSRVYVRLNGFPRWRVFLEYIMMPWRVFYGRRDTLRLFRVTVFRTLCVVPGVLTLMVHVQRAVLQLRMRASSPSTIPTTTH
jgi:anaerobic magnesium-protoporphyrin IX monomethyl ester cyclase